MAGEDAGPSLRRSSRKRKVISYKDLGAPSEDNDTPEPEFIEEEEEEEDDEPTFKPINKKRSLRNISTPEVPTTKVDKRSTNGYTTREGRLNSIGGTDESIRDSILQQLAKWRDVLGKVPEELLDYTIGWGICTGDWNGKGGSRQKIEIPESSLL